MRFSDGVFDTFVIFLRLNFSLCVAVTHQTLYWCPFHDTGYSRSVCQFELDHQFRSLAAAGTDSDARAYTSTCLMFTGLKRPGRDTVPSVIMFIIVPQLATSLLQLYAILRIRSTCPCLQIRNFWLTTPCLLFERAACLCLKGSRSPRKVAA
jgi:hypothetical protein